MNLDQNTAKSLRQAKTAVSTTYNDLFIFKEQLIKTWKPQSDVWALKYGDNIMGTLTAFGSIAITYLFRKAVKVRPYARMTCYMPVVGMSTLGSFAIHSFIISGDVVSPNACPLCISTKASLLQLAISLGYPVIAASSVCFYSAEKLLTYPIPPLLRAPKEVFVLFQNIILKTPRTFLVIGAMNMIAASFITFQKQNSYMIIEHKSGSSKPRE